MQGLSPGTTLLLVEDNPDDEALMLRAIKKTSIKEDVAVLQRIRANPATRLSPVVLYVLGASRFVRNPPSYSELIKGASQLVTDRLTINPASLASD